MKKPRGCLYSLVVLVVITFALGTISFYGSKFFDRFSRPWAYSTNEPLLIGHWKGQFRDPDGVSKDLNVTIFAPESDDERWEKAFRTRRRRHSRSSNTRRSFDGIANVVSRLGREEYELYGSVGKDDYHQLRLSFSADEKRLLSVVNFYISHVEQGYWQNDELNCLLNFSYRRPDKSSYSSTADSRFSKKSPDPPDTHTRLITCHIMSLI